MDGRFVIAVTSVTVSVNKKTAVAGGMIFVVYSYLLIFFFFYYISLCWWKATHRVAIIFVHFKYVSEHMCPCLDVQPCMEFTSTWTSLFLLAIFSVLTQTHIIDDLYCINAFMKRKRNESAGSYWTGSWDKLCASILILLNSICSENPFHRQSYCLL